MSIFRIFALVVLASLGLVNGSVAQVFVTFEKELVYEKQLEERITKSLSVFIKPSDFVLIVDVKLDDPKQADKQKRANSSSDDGLDTALRLPGILELPEAEEERDIASAIGSGDQFEDGEAKLSKIIITLFLDKGVPETKTELIQAVIIRSAQLNLNRGDELNIRVIDFATQQGPEGSGSLDNRDPTKPALPQGSGDQAGKSPDPQKDLLQNDRFLIYVLLAGMFFVICVLAFLLLRNRPSRNAYTPLPPPDRRMQGGHEAGGVERSTAQAPPQDDRGANKNAADTQRIDFEKERTKQDVISHLFSKPEAARDAVEEILREEGGLRSVAALVRLFGPETAKSLFTSLDQATVGKIFSYYMSVDTWNDGEPEASLQKFEQIVRGQKMHHLLEPDIAGPFGFARKMTEEQLAYLIKGEDIPVLALFMAHLPPKRSATLLSQMDPMIASRIAAEIGGLQNVNVDIISAVAKRLAEKSLTLPKFDFYPGSGLSTLVQILDNLDSSYEKLILSTLKEQDSQVAQDLQKIYFVFEDLGTLSQEQLKLIIKEVPRSILATALVSATPTVTQKILGLLPERRAEMLKFDIEKQLSVPAAEISKAQRMIVTKVRDMIKAGELDQAKLAKAAREAKLEITPEGAGVPAGKTAQ